MSDVTRILVAIERGERQAAEQLLPLVYKELRKLAAARLAQEKPGQTLQATALVHEAYLRLVDGVQVQTFSSRGHFFAAAAEAMRRILVDQARRKSAHKHGGHMQRVAANLDGVRQASESDDLLAVDTALEKLACEYPPVAKLVELKFFAGLTLEEAAASLNVSVRTAHRYWAYAKAWLHHEISHAERN
jgi:RNA polymerase sigma factor (TIGR02999 family)